MYVASESGVLNVCLLSSFLKLCLYSRQKGIRECTCAFKCWHQAKFFSRKKLIHLLTWYFWFDVSLLDAYISILVNRMLCTMSYWPHGNQSNTIITHVDTVWVWRRFSEFDVVLVSLTSFKWVWRRFSEFDVVLVSLTSFYWVWRRFSEFDVVLVSLTSF